MYKMKVVKEVGIAGWRYDPEVNFKYPEKVMYFFFERSILFAPFIGLRLNGSDVPSEHLVEVAYNFDSNEFFCQAANDNSIPADVEEEFDPDSLGADAAREFIADRVERKKQWYLSLGWRVYEG